MDTDDLHYLVTFLRMPEGPDGDLRLGLVVQQRLNDLHCQGYELSTTVYVNGATYLVCVRKEQIPQELRGHLNSQTEILELQKENLLRGKLREEAHAGACPTCQAHQAHLKGQ